MSNVPDDWGCYYYKCEYCGSCYHASEGGCGCTDDKVQCRKCDNWVDTEDAHETPSVRTVFAQNPRRIIRRVPITVHTCDDCLECAWCDNDETLEWDTDNDDWCCAKCRLEWITEDCADALTDPEIAEARLW
jgi:hypothetical protein